MLPRDEALMALADLEGYPFRGVLHRAVHLFVLERNPDFNPLFSRGPVLRGGRFTPKGGMPTLYATEDPATALAEANQTAALLSAIGAPAGPISPTVVFSFEVDLPRVLDLTSGAVQERLGLNIGEVDRPWEALQARGQEAETQKLGRWVYATGRFTAVRFASTVQPNGRCMAIFTERVTGSAFIRVLDERGTLHGQMP